MFEYLRDAMTASDFRTEAGNFINAGMLTKQQITEKVEEQFSNGYAPYDCFHEYYTVKKYVQIIVREIDRLLDTMIYWKTWKTNMMYIPSNPENYSYNVQLLHKYRDDGRFQYAGYGKYFTSKERAEEYRNQWEGKTTYYVSNVGETFETYEDALEYIKKNGIKGQLKGWWT